MNKNIDLLKNTLIIGVGTLGSKALTFFLLPYYTIMLTPEDFGLVDVLQTLGSLLIPLATLEMSSGVFRFIIESQRVNCFFPYSKSDVISTSFFVQSFGLIISSFLLLIIHVYIQEISYFFLFIPYFISMSLIKYASDLVRGLGDNKVYSLSSFIVSILSLLLNFILIGYYQLGAKAILMSNIIGCSVGFLFLMFKKNILNYIKLMSFQTKCAINILKYTLPLVINTVSWWVVNASNRLLILYFLTSYSSGIFAVANKIPSIYTILFNIFCLAWTESVTKNIDDIDFVANTIIKCRKLMIHLVLLIVCFVSLFFESVIGENYSSSYLHIYILVIGSYYASMSSLYGSVLGAFMESKSIAVTTITGAIINFLFSICFINYIGLFGASLAILVSYFIINILRERRVKTLISIISFNKYNIFEVALFSLFFIIYFYRNILINSLAICLIFYHIFKINKFLLIEIGNKIANNLR